MILAIDPGSRAMGIAMLDAAGKPLACVPLIASLSPGQRSDALERLSALRRRLDALVAEHGVPDGPDVTLVVEHLQGHAVNPAPTLEFWILCLRQWAKQHRWQHREYSPQQWRQVVAVKGAPTPTKADVRFWLLSLYPHLRQMADGAGGMDALEALGLALHAHDVLRIEAAAGRVTNGKG